jgi:hypothetical protein
VKTPTTVWARLWPTHIRRPGETDAERRTRVLTYPPPEGSVTGEPCPQLDLGDGEIFARLCQRGVDAKDAAVLVRDRDASANAHDRIDELLEHSHG